MKESEVGKLTVGSRVRSKIDDRGVGTLIACISIGPDPYLVLFDTEVNGVWYHNGGDLGGVSKLCLPDRCWYFRLEELESVTAEEQQEEQQEEPREEAEAEHIFELGDRVHSEKYGGGTVISICGDEEDDLPVCVLFDMEHNDLHSGSLSGSELARANRCWFFSSTGKSTEHSVTFVSSSKVEEEEEAIPAPIASAAPTTPEFKLYDRVRHKYHPEFSEGTILEHTNGNRLLVLFDKYSGGMHSAPSLGGFLPKRCWWCEVDVLQHV